MKRLGLVILMMVALVSCGNNATADVSIENMQNAISETNKATSIISFDFKNESQEKFSCVMSGIRNGETLNENTLMEVADNLGSHFAAGSTARIDNLDVIDAEKYGGKDNSGKTEGSPYGDANLCWAASAADMLVYGGWADDEDAVFSEFTENYFDSGAYQDVGLKFYFSGINKDQKAVETAGKDTCKDAAFIENEKDDLFSSTQVRNPGTKTGKIVNNGKLNEYVAENLYSQINASGQDKDVIASTLIEELDNGSAVGIGLVFYKGDSRVGVHAITATGYIKDEDGNLRGLVISDSDNDIELGKAYGNSAEETLADRQGRPNSYDVFLTDSFKTNDKEFVQLVDYKFSNSKLKYDNAVIQQVNVLKPRSSAQSADMEASGTQDAANTPDLILRNASEAQEETTLEAKVGEKLSIPFIVSNVSYKGYAANDKAVIKMNFIVYKGGNKVDSIPLDVALVTDTYTTGEANCAFSVTKPYTFKEAGNYRIDVEIVSVNSGSGKKLAEAYTGNNYLKEAATVTVK